MRCEQVQKALADYRCGEIGPEDAEHIAEHLSACAECSRSMEVLQAEDRMYAGYRADLDGRLEIPPAMWPNIRAALEQPRSREVPAWLQALSGYLPRSAVARQALFAAALIVISVGATLFAVRHYGNLREAPGVFSARRNAPNPQTLQGALQSIQRAEQEYLDAIQVLSAIVEQRKSTLDPRLVAELEANLKAIDESIADTRKAYHAHPADPELAHYMLAAYSKKVELLQEIAS